jgi:hypothetical protein
VASGSFEERAAAIVGRAAVRADVPLADLSASRATRG